MYRKLCAKFSKKVAIAIIASIVTVSVAVVSTLAFLIDKSDILKNIFGPGEINVSVTDTAIVNESTSDTAVYLCVTLVVNYQDSDGNVYRVGAVAGTDYKITPTDTDNWIAVTDKHGVGVYFFKSPVAAGANTGSLPATVTKLMSADDATAETDNNAAAIADGYTLKVQYLATAVQAKPTDAVLDAWGNYVELGTDGETLVKK